MVAQFFSPWTWKMAWRDSRASRRRLLLFSTSIVLGIAALVAIGSFGRNLERAIDEQAKTLLGADLVLSSRQAFTSEEEELFRSMGGEQSRHISFPSMIYFDGTNGGTRLVQVRAISGGFPFYGRIETAPVSAAEEFRRGGGALIEESLLIQYNAKVGDSVRVGDLTTRVAGSLRRVPGETVLFATIAPRVFIGIADLDKTGLLREGSLAQYRIFFKFPAQTNVTQILRAIRPQLDKNRLAYGTVEKRKQDFGRSLENLYSFLNLAGFVALLLGAVGVASAIHVHVKQKLDTVATLRCLGATVRQTFAIYLAQGMGIGLAGAIAGAALGLGLQQAIPAVVADFLPFRIDFQTSWPAVAQGMATGFGICVLFALLPLTSVRRVSPLAAIRSSYEPHPGLRRDPILWLVYLVLAAGILIFSLTQTQRWQQGLGFAGGLAVAFALLAGVAKLLVTLMRRLVPARISYVWRQGLANLHRPNNRTVLLVLAIGLGTFILLTSYLTKETLLRQVSSSRQSNGANTVLFDIQDDQREGVAELLRSQGLPLLDQAPVVTMRLSSIKGRSVEQLLTDRNHSSPRWVLRREYRSTFSDRLRDGERLIAGAWVGSVASSTSAVPVSLEQEIAKDLGVGLGDEIVFDVQGVPLATQVASLREVDWKRVQPNFFVVFPRGAIDDAPAFHVVVTRTASPDQSAALQRAVVQKFPTVSTIDLTLILHTVDSLLSKISFVVRFMALFIVITGLLVMAGSILTGRYQRIRESILLRTLGASRRQVLQILVVEYLALGALAATTGVGLAIGAGWALARFVFEVPFALPPLEVGAALALVTGLTVFTGLLTSRGVLNHPPLEILRAEA
jgi:putative ABC transport system permease protein